MSSVTRRAELVLRARGLSRAKQMVRRHLATKNAGTPQDVNRGIDAFTMDEAKAFCQRARLKINMPLAAGVSGSTAELINVGMTLGLGGLDLQKYAIAVLAYIGGGGNHSYHEIMIVLAAAGVVDDPDTYAGIKPLIGEDMFTQLAKAHPDAFKDPPPGVDPGPGPAK